LRRAVTASVAGGFVAVVGCSPAPTPVLYDDAWNSTPGTATVAEKDRPAAPRPSSIEPGKRIRWARADDVATLTQVGGRAPSQHGDGAWERTVWVNEAAAGYRTAAGGATMPAGALLLQRHHAVGQAHTTTIYLMEKLAGGASPGTGDWRYLVLDAELRVAASEQLQICARCHLEAPHGSLFGPPAGDP
jgi:hypothetical protein